MKFVHQFIGHAYKNLEYWHFKVYPHCYYIYTKLKISLKKHRFTRSFVSRQLTLSPVCFVALIFANFLSSCSITRTETLERYSKFEVKNPILYI